MSRKYILIIPALIAALMLSFSACGGKKSKARDSSAISALSSLAESLSPEKSLKSQTAGGFSESYEKYLDIKSKAYEYISGIIEKDDTLALSVGMSLLPVAMIDLSLIPLTVVGTGSGAEMALRFMGMEGVKIDQSGNNYTITYSNKDGAPVVQTCEFDPGTDSVSSSITTAEIESLFFEYVKTGSGYASQYTTLKKDSTDYTLMKCFFNDSDTAGFGFETVSGRPDSIYKNTALDSGFAVSREMYCILENDQLKVFRNGVLKTY